LPQSGDRDILGSASALLDHRFRALPRG